MIRLTEGLRKLAMVLAFHGEMDPENLPGFFRVLAHFLRNTPAEKFSYGKVQEHATLIPLSLEKPLDEALEGLLKDYPARMPSGRAGWTKLNFLYLLGQALSVAAMTVDLAIEMQKDSKKAEEMKKAAMSLYSIWGGPSAMNAKTLVDTYLGQKNDPARKNVAYRLERSEEAAKRLISVIGKDA